MGVALALIVSIGTPANAFAQNCGLWFSAPHCYSQIEYDAPSTPYGGMVALINQAPVDAGYSSDFEPWFISAEMWLIQNPGSNHWVEDGFVNGYVPTYSAGAYAIFNAYFDTTGTYHVNYPLAMGTPNNAGHKFQISRGGAPYSWIVQFDSAVVNTWSSVMWSGTSAHLGGEISTRNPPPPGYATPYANTFNQDGILLTIPNTQVAMGNTGTLISAGMNGISYYAGEWSWNAP